MHMLTRAINIVYVISVFLPYLHQVLLALAKAFPATKAEIKERWNAGK